MAQKLHNTYGFDYANLKVLLGGWGAWKDNNAKDPAAYPIETAPGVTPGAGSQGRLPGSDVTVLTPDAKPPAAVTP